jgi:membrane protein YdbS with pleckstrin-like domain
MEIFIGAIVSTITQLIKKHIPEKLRILIVIVLALIAGLIQFYLKQNVTLLQNVTAIFAYASGFYLLIIKQLERLTK